MRVFAWRVGLALATGLVFVAFSELMFWGRYDYAAKLLSDFLPMWVLYSVLAYVFLWVVSAFRVRRFAALFLAGAVYGWLGEGVVVQTMYDDFPLNLSWTGLAWHSLLTVCGGWYLLRSALGSGRPWRVAGIAAAAGVVWGEWSTWWWIDQQVITPLPEYTRYAFVTALLVATGLWASSRLTPTRFAPSRPEKVILGAAILAYFVGVTVRSAPLALAILPPCLGLALFALARNRRSETRPDLLAQQPSDPCPAAYLGLLALPLAAVGSYALSFYLHLLLPTGPAILIATALAGVILFVWSVVSLLRGASDTKAPRPGDTEGQVY